jgi:hypothetical protein
MTLKELLDSCDFKDIAAFLAQTGHTEDLPNFKQAFDQLRQIKPEPDSIYDFVDDEGVSIVSYLDDFDDTIKIVPHSEYPGYYAHSHNFPFSWEYSLFQEIVVEDGLTPAYNIVAALCLIKLTRWSVGGFCHYTSAAYEDIMRSYFDNSIYGKSARELDRKLTINYLPKRYKSGDKPRTCRNRSKRKRDYRQEQRIKKLKRMGMIEGYIKRFTENTCTAHEVSSFTRKELEYLFATSGIYQNDYYSYSYYAQSTKYSNPRIDYLIDLFSYETVDFSKATHFLLMFRTAQDYPLLAAEWEKIKDFFGQLFPPAANIRYGYGNNETLGTQVSLSLLCSY